ncbi:hypothetical protein QQP08_019420 [Theobroma cacao]|nr:hypothetical protein QQP08_019420 [Theobroma cacao]
MMKKVGYKQNWGAVAPAPLICPRRSSTCPRLETIHEEGYATTKPSNLKSNRKLSAINFGEEK